MGVPAAPKEFTGQYHGLVIYADFEAYQSEPHKISGYCILGVSQGDEVFRHVRSGEDNLQQKFIQDICELLESMKQGQYKKGDLCEQCGKQLREFNSYYGLRYTTMEPTKMHWKCWAESKNEYAKVIFHNFKGYDSHLIIGNLLEAGVS